MVAHLYFADPLALKRFSSSASSLFTAILNVIMVGCETSDVQGLYDPKKYDVMTVY